MVSKTLVVAGVLLTLAVVGAPQRLLSATLGDLILYRYPYSGYDPRVWPVGYAYSNSYNNVGASVAQASQNAASAWNNTWATWDYLKNPSGNIPIFFLYAPPMAGTVLPRYTNGGVCTSNIDENYPHCAGYIYSGDNLDQLHLKRSLVHELGHALASLKDLQTYDCSTIMSACWYDLNVPTGLDNEAAKEVHGTVDQPNLFACDPGGYTAQATARDNSTYDGQKAYFDLQKWTGSQWQYVYTRTGTSSGGVYSMCDDPGTGWFRYSIWVANSYPNVRYPGAFTHYPWAGYTNSLYVK